MGLITFDEEKHIYTHERLIIPGITQVLKEEGLTGRMPDPWYLQRGSAAHYVFELILKGKLKWSTVDPRIMPYAIAFQKFMEGNRFKARLIEEIVHSDIYRFACRLDFEGTMETDERGIEDAVVEFKTGGGDPWHGYQTAGQVICLPMLKKGLYKRYGLELREDEKYQLTPYPDRQDSTIALAAVTMWHAKNNIGRLRYAIGN